MKIYSEQYTQWWTPQSTEALARGVRQETEISHAN